MSTTLRAASGSSAENLFISLFEDVFGAEKTGYLYSQYPFFDIYQDSRFADFLLENGGRRVAIEIDDDASHLPGHVSQVKHYDDLTKQNSMIHMGNVSKTSCASFWAASRSSEPSRTTCRLSGAARSS